MLGIGIIALPYAFSLAGWVACTFLIPLIGYIMWYGTHIMLKAADHMEEHSNRVEYYENKNVTIFCENTLGPGWVPIVCFLFFGM